VVSVAVYGREALIRILRKVFFDVEPDVQHVRITPVIVLRVLGAKGLENTSVRRVLRRDRVTRRFRVLDRSAGEFGLGGGFPQKPSWIERDEKHGPQSSLRDMMLREPRITASKRPGFLGVLAVSAMKALSSCPQPRDSEVLGVPWTTSRPLFFATAGRLLNMDVRAPAGAT